MVLTEYQDILGKAAGSIGILHLVIPAGICLQIIRQGSVENISPGYFIIGCCITLMKIRHGQLLKATHMVTSGCVAFSICTVYLSIYLIYSDDKRSAAKLLGKVAAIPLLLLSYSFLDESSRAEYVYGMAVSTMMSCLMAFPIMQMRQTIKRKHTGDMSLAMALLSSVQSTLWFLYALTLGNYIEILSRLLFLVMSVPQLVLFCIYPMPKSTPTKKEEAKSS